MIIHGATWDRWATAFRGMGDGVKEALAGVLAVEALDANDYATHPDTPEEKRAGWCGRERGLRDLKQRVDDLVTGEYRKWPEYKAPDDESDDDEPAEEKETRAAKQARRKKG